jgi:hypothetical protein
MYYNLSLLATEGDEEDWFVELETFRSWTHAQGRQELIKSQLVSVASTLPAGAAFHGNAVYINPDVLVLEYNSTVTWERHLPGCFFTQVRNLDFETMPVFLSTGLAGNGGYTKPIGNSIIHAFSAISSSTSGRDTSLEIPLARVALPDRPSELEPKVVLVNWDLHHPIFSSPAKGSSLYYSEKMRDLAKKRAPEQPYLAVHWEMDTIDPKLLPDCAHALVDVLASLLRDESLSTNITTVWFASDYPYPIVTQNRSQRRPAAIAKSGTFKDFEIMHEEAIEILRSAFDKQGELNGWKLTDFIGTNEDEAHMEGGMLQDSGVIGILDKIVSMNADLFVSGSNRCSRRRYVASLEMTTLFIMPSAPSGEKSSKPGVASGEITVSLI